MKYLRSILFVTIDKTTRFIFDRIDNAPMFIKVIVLVPVMICICLSDGKKSEDIL
jgi:hypothetical protein